MNQDKLAQDTFWTSSAKLAKLSMWEKAFATTMESPGSKLFLKNIKKTIQEKSIILNKLVIIRDFDWYQEP
ncbi:hypothetical protein Leryth_023556 [Lithospermum erythrorhizon]|nr:hypothetical protein Leryth_023556 [Lithospermum erythrorhizon]